MATCGSQRFVMRTKGSFLATEIAGHRLVGWSVGARGRHMVDTVDRAFISRSCFLIR